MNAARAIRVLAVALSLCALTGCRVTDLKLWRPVGTADAVYEVQRVRDVAYCDGPRADAHRHRLDLYVPKGTRDFPVVLLVHGGAWVVGDNRCCGLYSSVGEYLAGQGIGVVLPNYRLSPHVKHPEHVRDLARAFAWTKRHIAEYGGRSDQIVLVGHSAGGHLGTLLATDPQYLKAEGCEAGDIRGVVGISGVYRIPEGDVELFLGGPNPLSLHTFQMMPMRGEATESSPARRVGPALSMKRLAHIVFGDDPQTRREASPMEHIRPGLPPFLLVNARHDLPMLASMAEEMHNKLRLHGNRSERRIIESCNHNSVIFNATQSSDPTARAIVHFVRAATAPCCNLHCAKFPGDFRPAAR